MSKPWKIVTTVLIAVVIPPGMAGWFLGYGWLVGVLRGLLWDMAFWGWPNWIGASISVAVSALWFALPWVVGLESFGFCSRSGSDTPLA